VTSAVILFAAKRDPQRVLAIHTLQHFVGKTDTVQLSKRVKVTVGVEVVGIRLEEAPVVDDMKMPFGEMKQAFRTSKKCEVFRKAPGFAARALHRNLPALSTNCRTSFFGQRHEQLRACCEPLRHNSRAQNLNWLANDASEMGRGMRKIHRCLIVVALFTGADARVGAQSGVSDQLNAEKANSYLYLVKRGEANVNGKYSFDYSVDEHAAIDVLAPMPDLLTVSARRSHGLNVVLRYLNPIRYSWSATETTADDPTYHAAEQFLSSALNLFSSLGGSATGSGASAAGSGANNVGRLDTSATPQKAGSAGVSATTLLEWWLWSEKERACFKDPAFSALRAKVQKADQMVFGSDSIAKELSDADFRRVLLGSVQQLKDAESIALLRVSLLAATDSLKKLRMANSRARNALGAIGQLDSSTVTNSEDCLNFARYSNNVFTTFTNQAKDRLDARDKVVADLTDLRDKVQILVNEEVEDTYNYFRVMNVGIPPGKTKDVTLVLKERDVNTDNEILTVSDKGESKITFRVEERESLVLEFAPGIAYTSVHYPKYGTSGVGSGTVVASAGDDIQHEAAVGMLNIIPNVGYGLTHVIGQIGIGTGKNYPLLLAGAGVRFLSPIEFSLTTGAAWSWAHQLTKLKLQDPVDGTAVIESDLTWQIQKPKLYVAAQHSF
jgi:hypothetical protein